IAHGLAGLGREPLRDERSTVEIDRLVGSGKMVVGRAQLQMRSLVAEPVNRRDGGLVGIGRRGGMRRDPAPAGRRHSKQQCNSGRHDELTFFLGSGAYGRAKMTTAGSPEPPKKADTVPETAAAYCFPSNA